MKTDNKGKALKTIHMALLGCCCGLVVGGILMALGVIGTDKEVKTLLATINAYDLSDDYPTTPVDVIKIYNEVMLYLYSGGAKPSEIAGVVEQQRKLLSEEILKINPPDSQVDKIKLEVRKLKLVSKRILSIEFLETRYGDDGSCDIKVVQEINKGTNSVIVYKLKLEGQRWKIDAWEEVS